MEKEKDMNLAGNEEITEALRQMYENLTDETLAYVLTLIRRRMQEGGHFVVAVNSGADGAMEMRTVKSEDGRNWFAAYTDMDEQLKGKDRVMSGFTAEIGQIFRMVLASEGVSGIILNPWERPLKLDRRLVHVILGEQ